MAHKPASAPRRYHVHRPLTVVRDHNLPTPHRITQRQPSRVPGLLRYTGLAALIASMLGIACGVLFGPAPRHAPAEMVQVARFNPVVQALAAHPTAALAGDYLQIHAVRQASGQTLYARPTVGCGQIASPAHHALRTVSYAYLFTETALSGGSTGCSVAQIINIHGKPTARVTIASTPLLSSSTLLFYDRPHHAFITKHHAAAITPPIAIVAPVAPALPPPPPIPTLQDLTNTQCPTQSIMNIVAHQDDDLFFMNPDTSNDIQAGNCIRSVYLTAGDDGKGSYYWLARQKGVEAAYDTMLGSSSGWLQRKVNIGDGRYATIATPYASPRVSLVFLALPDGNLAGDGFPSTGHTSLEKLHDGSIPGITSLQYRSSYSSAGLVSVLANLINTYRPAVIRTQADDSGTDVAEHSDHIAAGIYAAAAASASSVPAGITYYQGYPIRELPANVSDTDLAAKAAIFSAYARYDSEACKTYDSCQAMGSSYSAYLERQYHN